MALSNPKPQVPIDFGLLGASLSHSFSPQYFKEKFEREGIIGQNYLLFERKELSHDVFRDLVIQNPNLAGLNVTIPYKEDVMPLLDEIDSEAGEIGAVNTIKIIRNGNKNPKCVGYNTDIAGIYKSLHLLLSGQNIPEKALILGSGGASLSVEYGLRQMGIDYSIVSRNSKRPKSLAWNDLNNDIVSKYLLIINTTPLGMFPNMEQMPPLPMDKIGENHHIFDLIYNPDPSLLLKTAQNKGANVISGKLMLETQAELSYKIWTRDV
jgi:shikimate dehydrogenase